MVTQRWLSLVVLPIAAGALLAWWAAPRMPFFLAATSSIPQEKPAPKEPSLATANSRLVGSAGCSARGCHGAIDTSSFALDPEKCLQNEYVRWAHDRHADAYQVLRNDKRSHRMMQLLEGRERNRQNAYEDPRCLACHTNPLWSGLADEHRPADEKTFGVGCESCHGSASKWLVPHTKKSWRQLSAQEKWDKYDMVPVTDPVRLAQTCAGCHVGAPADPARGLPLRDVNHDLIAAGHPRLNFEFGTFLANMPPHWRPTPKSEGHYWAVGQFVSAQAGLELLSARAKSGPWPEFAEYDCYSCHHSLTQSSWRQKRTESVGEGRRPGSLPWGSWYYPLFFRGNAVNLDALRLVMEKPMPDRKRVQDLAPQARIELDLHSGLTLDKKNDMKNEEIRNWLKVASQRAEPSWDSAEQIYLGLFALNQSQSEKATTELLDKLAPIRTFAPGFDGPISWKTNGRPAFHPDDFFKELKTRQP